MANLTVTEKIFGRFIVDPCIRRGIVPINGIASELFERIAKSRIIRIHPKHPISLILSKNEWKSSYSISDHSLMWLWNFVNTKKVQNILEMGSGMSTLLFALYASISSQCVKIVSFDHDKKWLQITAERLQMLGLGDFVELTFAPIETISVDSSEDVLGYKIDTPSLLSQGFMPDVVLIDGPPRAIGRMGTLPSVRKLLKPGATILVDDAFREDERRIIRSWTASYPELSYKGSYPLGTGLCRIEVNK